MNNKKTKLILLAAAIILALGLIVFNNVGRKPAQQANVPGVVIPTPVILSEGSFNIAQEINAEAKTGSIQEFEITADSNQRSIVAYDLVVTYEPNSLEILSAESLLPDFKVYPLEKKDYFVLTGVKDLDSDKPVILKGESIVKLKILPKKGSAISIKVVDSFGKEKTQMVDTKSEILRPKVAEFTTNE